MNTGRKPERAGAGRRAVLVAGCLLALCNPCYGDGDFELPDDVDPNLPGGGPTVRPQLGKPVSQAEYFLGPDPGEGNATPVSVTDATDLSAALADVAVSLSLPPGTHAIGLRVKDDAGRWSNPLLRRFTVSPGTFKLPDDVDPNQYGGGITVRPPLGKPVTRAEYFLGPDPGEGNATPVSVTDATDLSAAMADVAVSLSRSLSPGTHAIGLRVRDDAGRWSNPLLRRFMVSPGTFKLPDDVDPNLYGGGPTVRPPLGKPVTQAEYFLGTDPGAGNATPVSVTDATDLSAALADVAGSLSLPPGTHAVGLRVKDDAGRWSNPLLRRFTVLDADLIAEAIAGIPPDVTPPQAPRPQVHQVFLGGAFQCGGDSEVRIGGHPVVIQARPFEPVPMFLDRLVLAINSDPATRDLVLATRNGFNGITITSKANQLHPDDWVSASGVLLSSVVQYGTIGEEARKMVAAECFVDAETPPGSGTPISLAELDPNSAAFTATAIPITSLRAGFHKVGVRFRNAAGHWGNPVYRGFYNEEILDLTPPTITLNGGIHVEVPFLASYTEPGYSATDPEDGDLTAQVVRSGEVDTAVPGDYSVRYSVVDAAGNKAVEIRTVRVVDVDAPRLVAALDLNYTEPPGTIDLFADLVASDVQFGDLTHRIRMVSNDVNWFEPGSYEAVFEVADPVGNTASLTRTITLGEQAVFYPPFGDWMQARGSLHGAPPEDLLPGADPDADGVPNAAEWQADTDPFNPWSKLEIHYHRSPTEEGFNWDAQQRIAYLIESSANFQSWLPITPDILAGTGCHLEWTKLTNPLIPQLFYRLSARPRQPVLPGAP
ncbi:MAG: DUF5011 domain-containing protein [Verrucomicrobia bacterium]|nr:DUF5011 domain-containing protein [Verrucomicrobiota bacterium]